jgi:hypothetical protein
MECLGLHNKPKAEVHPEHLLTDPKEKEEEEEEEEARPFTPVFIGYRRSHDVTLDSYYWLLWS